MTKKTLFTNEEQRRAALACLASVEEIGRHLTRIREALGDGRGITINVGSLSAHVTDLAVHAGMLEAALEKGG